MLVDRQEVWQGRWLAGNIPGWTSFAIETAVYQSHYLLDDGRLFFNSTDALVPQDVNGAEDVYQYEPYGVGDCHGENGCVNLISSGTSGEESAFLDATPSGNDAFFLTAGRLTAQDGDDSLDVYDAHVCSPEMPCQAPPAPAPPPCSTADSCRGPSSQPTTPPESPATTTLSGPGTVSQPVARPRSLTRSQLLAAALRACRKQPRGKRHRCDARARRRYGHVAGAIRHATHRASSGRAGR